MENCFNSANQSEGWFTPSPLPAPPKPNQTPAKRSLSNPSPQSCPNSLLRLQWGEAVRRQDVRDMQGYWKKVEGFVDELGTGAGRVTYRGGVAYRGELSRGRPEGMGQLLLKDEVVLLRGLWRGGLLALSHE
jgi:hypothetical protein